MRYNTIDSDRALKPVNQRCCTTITEFYPITLSPRHAAIYSSMYSVVILTASYELQSGFSPYMEF